MLNTLLKHCLKIMNSMSNLPKLMNPVHQVGIMNEYILPIVLCFDAGGNHCRTNDFRSEFLLKGVLSSEGFRGGLCPWSTGGRGEFIIAHSH